MKRKPEDIDAFEIKAKGNQYDPEHRTRQVEMPPCGESSPYQDWVEENGGYDPISLDALTDADLPWVNVAPNEEVQEQWESFKAIYPSLTPKQRAIVRLLLSGQTDQTAIGAMLGITRQAVGKTLIAIRKKIVAEMGCDLDVYRHELEETYNEPEDRNN